MQYAGLTTASTFDLHIAVVGHLMLNFAWDSIYQQLRGFT